MPNKRIIIGCPYTSMSNLNMAFSDIGEASVEVVNCDDVIGIDSCFIYTNAGNKKYRHEDFSSSFVRYPYDLIPPHSETFELREETEFYKTIALTVDSISLNSLASTWILRNRSYSLSQAQRRGVNIADYAVIKNVSMLAKNERKVIKALGNCFVANGIDSLPEGMTKIFRVEEDDGETAAILPASLLNSEEIIAYLSTIGVAFVQHEMLAEKEFRGYIIGDASFVYEREGIEGFDKSAGKYFSTNYKVSNRTILGLKKMTLPDAEHRGI